MNKKAQGMPLEVVIIIAILLIVLVIILFIFSGRAKTFTSGLENCVAKGGECKYPGDCRGPVVTGTDCEKSLTGQDTGKICCLKV